MTTYTNLGTMSYARISSIRSQERLHWYLGLRQAELEIETRLKPALEDNFLELEILTQKITDLESQQFSSNKFEIIKLQRQKRRIELLIPGTIAELHAAESEKERIVSVHQNELSLDSQTLEESISRECYLARCSQVISGATLRSLGYNDSEAQLLLDLPPEDQLEVMAKVQSSNAGAVAALSNALSRVSPFEAKRIVELVDKEVSGYLMEANRDIT
jgi:hypothetical protein